MRIVLWDLDPVALDDDARKAYLWADDGRGWRSVEYNDAASSSRLVSEDRAENILSEIPPPPETGRQ